MQVIIRVLLINIRANYDVKYCFASKFFNNFIILIFAFIKRRIMVFYECIINSILQYNKYSGS